MIIICLILLTSNQTVEFQTIAWLVVLCHVPYIAIFTLLNSSNFLKRNPNFELRKIPEMMMKDLRSFEYNLRHK